MPPAKGRGKQSSPRSHAIMFTRRGLLSAALVALFARSAAAQMRTCVQVEPGRSDREALTRLVKTEMDRHPTHRAATEDCQGYLTVEMIDLGVQNEQWVTGRINTQVPYREKVGPDGIAPAVQRLLTVVLNNDPLILKGPESNTWLRRQGRALERESAMHFGGEIYELTSRLGSDFDFLPGVAVVVRREVSALHIGARVGGAFNPGRQPDRLHLNAQIDAQIEGAVYATPTENTSLFASALVGLVHYRFEGPATLDGPGVTGRMSSSGLSLGVRGGVEAMRTSDVRLVAFLQVAVPAFKSSDPDHGVVNNWVPSLAIGAGLLY